MRLTAITELSRASRLVDETGLTRVALHLLGRAGDETVDATLVYTRTWRLHQRRWQVIQAHASALA